MIQTATFFKDGEWKTISLVSRISFNAYISTLQLNFGDAGLNSTVFYFNFFIYHIGSQKPKKMGTEFVDNKICLIQKYNIKYKINKW